MSLAQSIPAPVSYRVDDSTSIRFRRIGLDLWSQFCEHIKENRVAEIESLSLNDSAKGDLFKGLIGTGIDMDAMLNEAATMAGMCWIIARCCLDDVKESELMRVIPLVEVPVLFKRLADVEQQDEEAEGESGGN
jgi:hypothetical protein